MPVPVPIPAVKIPVGLATKVGYALGLVQIAVAALIPIIQGIPDDASTSAIVVALVLGATTVITRVNDGRQKQAAAVYADAPSPAQMDDSSGELDAGEWPDVVDLPQVAVPDDAALAERYGAEGPEPEGAVGGKPGLEG